jgi:CubicO group peptidase (beta-lactamase class C family)
VAEAGIASSARLEELTAGFLREHRPRGLAGVAAGVVWDGELAWSAGCGRADVAAGRAPDETTLLAIASVTKTFTGTAIMQLAGTGGLHLDDPAVRHLPELRAIGSPFGPVETLTIRRMLSHESGLQGEPPGTDWAGPAYDGSAARNLARAAEFGLKVPPNSQSKYSNLGYQLLGEIVARVSGTPYPDYLRQAVLEPLGLSSTGFEPLPAALAARRATGYRCEPFTDVLVPAAVVPPVQAEGGLWSSVADLARWLSFQLSAYPVGAEAAGVAGAARAGAGKVLPAAQLRAMHTPRYLADPDWARAWGISWFATRKDGVVWIQHDGGLPGFTSTVCFDRARPLGAIVLANGIAPTAELAFALASAVGEETPGRPAAGQAVPVPAAVQPLLGLYSVPELGVTLRLEWRDGALVLTDPEVPSYRPELTPAGDQDTFTVGPGFRESGEKAVFHRRAGGQVTAMFLAAMTLTRLDPVPAES